MAARCGSAVGNVIATNRYSDGPPWCRSQVVQIETVWVLESVHRFARAELATFDRGSGKLAGVHLLS